MQSQQGRSLTKPRILIDKKCQLVYYLINKFTPFCHSPENGNLDVCFYWIPAGVYPVLGYGAGMTAYLWDTTH